MASSLTTASRNTAVSTMNTATTLSLHTGDPGANGTLLEVSGGSPAYARRACAWGAAVNGVLPLNADVVFDVPAGTVAFVGMWEGATYRGCFNVTDEVFAAQGTYTLRGTSTTITIA